MDLVISLSTALGLVGLFGWSHTAIRRRLDKIEADMAVRPNQDQIRTLIAAKLAPHKVEYDDLARRMKEMKEDQKELSRKMDKVIELCQKLK